MRKLLVFGLAMSFNAFSATVDLNCIGGTLEVSGNNDLQVKEILLQERVSLTEDSGALVIMDATSMRLISDQDLSPIDDGKLVIALHQNVDPEGQDPVGLNITRARINLSRTGGVEVLNLTQLGDINNVDILEMDIREKYFLKCENAR